MLKAKYFYVKYSHFPNFPQKKVFLNFTFHFKQLINYKWLQKNSKFKKKHVD
jgi:hypothetical protein